VGFLGRHLHLNLGNRASILFKKEVSRIDNENCFLTLLRLFDPSSSPGQTAKPIFLVSGWAGINFAIDIVAVK
jgi:hypothetical protein